MDKQGSTKSPAATNTSKETKIVVNNKPANSSNFNQKKSGKNRSKYTKLFEMCNIPDRPNTCDRTPITITSPEKVLIDRREKSINATDFDSSSVVLTKKVSEKKMVQVVPEINKKKEESTHALGKSSIKSSSMAKQSKKTALMTENYDKKMFGICLTIVDEFSKQAQADKNADEEMANKKKVQKSTTLGQIASADVKKRKSSAATNASKEKNISVNVKPTKSSILNQRKSGKNRSKYTKLFEMCNIPDRPNTCARTPITITSPEKVFIDRREKSINTTDFASSSVVLTKKISEKKMVQVVPEINKKKEESTHALGKSSIKASSMAIQPKKTGLTSENYDKEMLKLCLTIVDEFLKRARADKNADEKMINKKKVQMSTTLGQIASDDVKKKPITSVCQSSEKSCTDFDKPDQRTDEEKKKDQEKKKSKNSRKKMKKLIKLSEGE